MKEVKFPPNYMPMYIHDISYNCTGSRVAVSSASQIYIFSRSSSEKQDLAAELTFPELPEKHMTIPSPTTTKYSTVAVGLDSSDGEFNTPGQPKYASVSHLKSFLDEESAFIKQSSHEQYLEGKHASVEESSGEWKLNCILEGKHTEPVWRVDWAPSEYGNILASCSEDRAVIIWMESVKDLKLQWFIAATFKDARCPVSDLQFAPPHFGIRLAVCDEEGSVRIFRIPKKDCHHPALEEQFYSSSREEGGCAAVSWNTSREDMMTLAVIGKAGSVKIHGKLCMEEFQSIKWQLLQNHKGHAVAADVAWCPNLCRPYDLLCTCGTSPSLALWRFEFDGASAYAMQAAAKKGARREHFESQRSTSCMGALPINRRHMTRTPHIGGQSLSSKEFNDIPTDPPQSWGVLMLLQKWDIPAMIVWRLCWNPFGTVFAAATDFKIHFWKEDDDFVWKSVYEIDRLELLKSHWTLNTLDIPPIHTVLMKSPTDNQKN
ncbi:hypothetical protein IE077_001456 [Cardiosporidium cionae]|uniref:Nucleoporin SEH1 n=1 Tax=Cardiosporidium cionae TaxID=476202 RepID=A0ABQ7JCU0_9APIC|nr:hypothetical protein IE077_001456 [Cardiosporidium cionae]|eukprot:KAF8821856.1 hypothetical protein IE077_001456 [Cardiosporidium cionae]